jgi:predicted ATPase/DNA-binding SARP family transcriptional activator
MALAGQPVTYFKSVKMQALLAYLAVEADRPHRREELAGLLWPDQPEQVARHNLSQTLLHLRQAIRNQEAAPSYLLISRQTIQFNPDSDYWLDVAAFANHLAVCQIHAHTHLEQCPTCIEQLQQAVTLYQGRFLDKFSLADSDLFEEWALLKREMLHRQAVEALGYLIQHYEWRGEYKQALTYARRQSELEPLLETAHRSLMRLLVLDGQRSAALAQYEVCRRLLAEELGVDPAPATVELYEQIKAGDWGNWEAGEHLPSLSPLPPRPSAPLQNLPLHPPTSLHHLPSSLTTFIGRTEELVQMKQLLFDESSCRLLTLVGPGGIGKTRLALQAVAETSTTFPDGVYFVSLVGVSEAELLVPAIAEALRFAFYGQTELKTQLLNYLAGKAMLLVLDNFEHLLASPERGTKEGAALLLDLLGHAPRVKLLVTSRERLHLQSEWLLPVRGLPFPATDQADDVEDTSAVQLFIQRARQVQPDFALSAAEKSCLARLCRLLEGMPLGIELAATWVRLLSCAEIVQQLERNLDFLVASWPDVPGRHHSLRAVFDHSWGLLSVEAQTVLAQLSVFQGGFRLEAAQQVARASMLTLAELVDKSLLRRTPSGRYEIHELLRQYAADQLKQSPSEAEVAEDRHCHYYANFLHHCEKRLESEQQVEAMAELVAEIDNIRAGWAWAIRSGRAVLAATISQYASGLRLLYERRGWFREGAALFKKAGQRLAQERASAPDQFEVDRELAYGRVLWQQGFFTQYLAHFEPAKELYAQSLAALQATHAPWDQGMVLKYLGIMAWQQGDYAAAKQHLAESADILSTIDASVDQAKSVLFLGIVAHDGGEYNQAEALLRQSLAILQATGELWHVSLTLNYLGRVVNVLGQPKLAQQLWQESLTISRDIGGLAVPARMFQHVGDIIHTLNDAEQVAARQFLQENVAICQKIGDEWGAAIALNQLGHITIALKEYPAVEACFGEALKIALKLSTLPLALEALLGLATLLTQQTPLLPASQERALTLLTLVLNHPASMRSTQDRAAGLLAELKKMELPPAVVLTAQRQGQAEMLKTVAAGILGGVSLVTSSR